MNAPTDKTVLAEPDVDLIPVDAIAPSQTHIQQLRRKRFVQDAITELAASMLKAGQLQAIVVRPHPKGQPQFELVLGERRWLAAKLAGLKLIEAKTTKLSDAQVLEVQLIENLQREELQPLEEAAGYEELMRVGKLKPEDLGEKVGKSRSWVYSRLNLMKLDGAARDALQTGRLDVSRAMVVAMVAQPNQRAEALDLALQTGSNDKPIYSVRELRQKIVENKLSLPLIGAPFDMKDAKLLPDVGACGECPYRTANCDPGALDPDVCTNAACFHLKVKAAGDAKRKAILAGGGKVLRGEDARKISPSVKTVYGHVDLDLVCGHDDFPEKEPKEPANVDHDDYGERTDAPYLAWAERERLWQPRTYRALLQGQKYQTVVLDDPKTKQLRELVPFKVAQQLLKKVGINLPSYADRKRPAPVKHTGGTSTAAKKDPAKEAAEQAQRELEEKTGEEIHRRIFAAIKDKHDGKLGVEELRRVADALLYDVPSECGGILWQLFGQKDPGYQTEKALAKIQAKDLPKLITLAALAEGLDMAGRHGQTAERILARFKIDRKKIEAEVRAALAPKRPVDKVIAGIEKREQKAKSKSKGKKK